MIGREASDQGRWWNGELPMVREGHPEGKTLSEDLGSSVEGEQEASGGPDSKPGTHGQTSEECGVGEVRDQTGIFRRGWTLHQSFWRMC